MVYIDRGGMHRSRPQFVDPYVRVWQAAAVCRAVIRNYPRAPTHVFEGARILRVTRVAARLDCLLSGSQTRHDSEKCTGESARRESCI